MSAPIKENLIQRFLNDSKPYPLFSGLVIGIYPTLFYFTNNFTFVNSITHFFFFLIAFILLPAVVVYSCYQLSKKFFSGKYIPYVIPTLSSFLFFFLLHIAHFGTIKKKISLGLLGIACLIGYFLWRHVKKITVIQLLLAIIGLITFIPKLYDRISYDDSWSVPEDAIKEVLFTKKPNVYFIQPDGYVNFSELYSGHYGYDNKDFENFLKTQNFTLYPNFRSNYVSTLTSNSAIFMMKHHYYNNKITSELLQARDIIVSKNNVIDIFKNNGYKTHLLLEKPYFLVNRPEMGYDYCNIDYSEFGYIGNGLRLQKEISTPLASTMQLDKEQPKFFFIEKFLPGHIQHNPKYSEGIAQEKNKWFEKLDIANEELKKIITLIKKEDPESVIIVMSDHGGFVGMHNTQELHTKTQDRDILYSIFSSHLAIHWPEGDQNGTDIKSSVNMFRVLFSYLSEDKKYLQYTEDNGSYIVIKEGAPKGIYQCINDSGEVTFIKQ